MKTFQYFQTEVYYILEKYEPFPHEKVANKIKSKEKEAKNVFNKTLTSRKELKAIRNRPADPGRIGSNRYWELRDAHKANPGDIRLKQKFENERKKLREIQKQDEKANEYHIPNVERSNRRLKKTASQIKKMKKAMNRHDPVENRFRELENKNKGDIKLKQRIKRKSRIDLDIGEDED